MVSKRRSRAPGGASIASSSASREVTGGVRALRRSTSERSYRSAAGTHPSAIPCNVRDRYAFVSEASLEVASVQRPSGNRERVATLGASDPIVGVARVSPHHGERFRVGTAAVGAGRRRDVNPLRGNRGRNETGARVLHDALQWLMCAWGADRSHRQKASATGAIGEGEGWRTAAVRRRAL
jgi:hypothetical protein